MTDVLRTTPPGGRARFSIPAICTVVVLVAGLGAGLAACSSGGASESAAPTTTVISGNAGTVAAPTGSPEAVTLLTGALESLGVTYHFVTTVRVADEIRVTAEGDRVGDGARLDLTAEGGTVSYVITDDGAWARPENGEWVELDTPPASTDPIAALAAAMSVDLGPSTDGVQVLNVVVNNDNLGIAGGGTSTLTVTLVDGRLDQITYRTTLGDQEAEATTILSAAKDPSPVAAPL